MKPILHRLQSFFFRISIVLFIFLASSTHVLAIEQNLENIKLKKLEDKVVKSYSSKFCNAIGIGVSIEGATKLTINENKESKFNPSLWFEIASSGEKNLNTIRNEGLEKRIAQEISKDCGAAIGVVSGDDINNFTKYLKLIKESI